MAWIIGIDEAGYGPNLGPFVMSAVACQLPDRCAGDCLWALLTAAVRRGTEADDGRILIDDSKKVYATARGLAGLELGVHAAIWREGATLQRLLGRLCPADVADLQRECWYQGDSGLPLLVTGAELAGAVKQFDQACAGAEVRRWLVGAAVVCPPRFNAILDVHGSKGAVLADALCRLIGHIRAQVPDNHNLFFYVDKHGGRNTYAAFIQHALPDGVVVARQEGMARSAYQVYGLGREVRFVFQPRAEADYFCVALASMTAKYLREVLMREFNAFWQRQVPGLKPTAGYPGDAARFLDAIRPATARLGIAESALWRRK
jgi:ribonuclease HII